MPNFNNHSTKTQCRIYIKNEDGVYRMIAKDRYLAESGASGGGAEDEGVNDDGTQMEVDCGECLTCGFQNQDQEVPNRSNTAILSQFRGLVIDFHGNNNEVSTLKATVKSCTPSTFFDEFYQVFVNDVARARFVNGA